MGAAAYRIELDERLFDSSVIGDGNTARNDGRQERDPRAAALEYQPDRRSQQDQARGRDDVTVPNIETVERRGFRGLVGRDHIGKLVDRDPVQEASDDQQDRRAEQSGSRHKSCSVEIVARRVGHGG